MARGMYVLCEIEDVLARAGHRKAAADENADTLVAGDELIFPTSRMLRGFARSGAEVVLISHRPEALESATKKWLRDFGIDHDGAAPCTRWSQLRNPYKAHACRA